ncbi:MAG: histidine phosphatase family protein [Candidatus Puniceispirillaceae bacterium]
MRVLSLFSFVIFCCSSFVAVADSEVIFLRHALAPGTGDPAHFQIDDCSTQRNLNEEGRLQATVIGQELKDKGLVPTRILSSPWCRCKQTAALLGLGTWQTHFGLSSFYEGHVDRDEVLAALKDELDKLADGERLLLVTHQVVIQAVTGLYMPSGGYVVINSQDINWQ